MTTLAELQARCARTTLSRTEPEASHNERLAMAALWLTSEAGEVATEVRKAIVAREEWPTVAYRLTSELGDLLWCVCEVASLAGIDLERAAQEQADKQRMRYADVIRLHDVEGA